MAKAIDLSLILACYNEGPTFRKSLEAIDRVLKDTKYSYEVICIDDKSKDSTLQTLKQYSNKRKNWRIFLHKKNKGRGATVKEGILKAKGKVVGYIDVDLEVSAVYIPEFVRQVKDGADIVIATRVYRVARSNLIRALSTVSYASLSRMTLNHQIADTEAGYKFFSRSAILPVLKKCQNDHWFFDTEILMLGLDRNLKIIQIPVLFLKRQDKVSTVKLFSDTIQYLFAIRDFKKRR